MSLKHADVWRAVDKVAERSGLSPSGLARKAGLSPTAFNPSKRATKKRKRWPSTESIAYILQATGVSLEEFVAFAAGEEHAPRAKLPLLGYGEAGRKGYFDDAGYPNGRGWDELGVPQMKDPHAFALEISGKSMEPVFRQGDRIIVSPADRPRRDDRVVVRTQKGEVLVKELGHESAGKIELLSLNPAFKPITFMPSDIDWMYRIVWVSQ